MTVQERLESVSTHSISIARVYENEDGTYTKRVFEYKAGCESFLIGDGKLVSEEPAFESVVHSVEYSTKQEGSRPRDPLNIFSEAVTIILKGDEGRIGTYFEVTH